MKAFHAPLWGAFAVWMGAASLVVAAEPAKPAESTIAKWVPATAYVIPKETAPEGEGYTSLIEGLNGRLYIGTHANAVNSWLVEFDPQTQQMTKVVDVHQAIGTDLKGFGSQAKIHTRNNVGKLTGKIYFGTKQGYPSATEKREDYPGGYPIAYDPKTGKTEVWPIPVKHQGVTSVMPDESRGLVYVATCSDLWPGPGESSAFLVLDLKTGKYQKLIDADHLYPHICLDHQGRAYNPVKGGKIARYDPETRKLDLLEQTIDGQPPKAESHLIDEKTHSLHWDASPDGKTLYCVPMSTNQLYAYDLTGSGNVLAGRSLGPLVVTDEQTDCRAMAVAATGQVAIAVTVKSKQHRGRLLHVVTYRPGDMAPIDHGVVEVTNPDFTTFTDAAGKPLPYHAGFYTVEGRLTTKRVVLGVWEAADGAIYMLALHPYTLLQVKPGALQMKPDTQ